jgi:hypothetical protein
MTFLNTRAWEIGGGLVCAAGAGALAYWLLTRNRPTPEEIERARRDFLVQSGRLVDGMLLDICDVLIEDGRTLTMLMFNYGIGGVSYECSQDITDMHGVVDLAQVRVGFPCTVRYQPGNPQNSIVVAEEWTGMRTGIPVLPVFDNPEPLDLSHLRPGRG